MLPDRIPSINLKVNSLLTSSGCLQIFEGHNEGYPTPLKMYSCNSSHETINNKERRTLYIRNFFKIVFYLGKEKGQSYIILFGSEAKYQDSA